MVGARTTYLDPYRRTSPTYADLSASKHMRTVGRAAAHTPENVDPLLALLAQPKIRLYTRSNWIARETGSRFGRSKEQSQANEGASTGGLGC